MAIVITGIEGPYRSRVALQFRFLTADNETSGHYVSEPLVLFCLLDLTPLKPQVHHLSVTQESM